MKRKALKFGIITIIMSIFCISLLCILVSHGVYAENTSKPIDPIEIRENMQNREIVIEDTVHFHYDDFFGWDKHIKKIKITVSEEKNKDIILTLDQIDFKGIHKVDLCGLRIIVLGDSIDYKIYDHKGSLPLGEVKDKNINKNAKFLLFHFFVSDEHKATVKIPIKNMHDNPTIHVLNNDNEKYLGENIYYVKTNPKIKYVDDYMVDKLFIKNGENPKEYIQNKETGNFILDKFNDKPLVHDEQYTFWAVDKYGYKSNEVTFCYRNKANFDLDVNNQAEEHKGIYYVNDNAKFTFTNKDILKSVTLEGDDNVKDIDISDKNEYSYTFPTIDKQYTFTFKDQLGHEKKYKVSYRKTKPVIEITTEQNKVVKDSDTVTFGVYFKFTNATNLSDIDLKERVKFYYWKDDKWHEYTNRIASNQVAYYTIDNTIKFDPTKHFDAKVNIFDSIRYINKVHSNKQSAISEYYNKKAIITKAYKKDPQLVFIDRNEENLAIEGQNIFQYDFTYIDSFDENGNKKEITIKYVCVSSADKLKKYIENQISNKMLKNIASNHNLINIEENRVQAFKVEFTDRAKNKTVKQFRIDKRAPIFKLYYKDNNEDKDLKVGEYTNKDIFFKITSQDNTKFSSTFVGDYQKIICIYDGQTYEFNKIDGKLKDILNIQNPLDGIYSIQVMDIHGNVSAPFSFILDKTKPKMINYEKYINKKSLISFDDKNIYRVYLKNPNNEASQSAEGINIIEIPDTLQGKYILNATDLAGNKSDEYIIYFDSIAPYITGIVDITNEDKRIKAEDTNVNKIMYSLNNAEVQSFDDKEIVLSKEGNYEIWALDKVGNKSIVYNMIIDKSAPHLLDFAYYDDIKGVYYIKDLNNIKIADNVSIKNYDIKVINNDNINNYNKTYNETVKSIDLLSENLIVDPFNYLELNLALSDTVGNTKEYTVYVDNKAVDSIVINNDSLRSAFKDILSIDISDNKYGSKVSEIKIINLKSIEIVNNKEVLSPSNLIVYLNTNVNKYADISLDYESILKEYIVKDGIYKILVKDILGNTLDLDFIKYSKKIKYINNENALKDSFKELKSYRVTLPAGIFFEQAGIYTFKDIESARKFALDREEKARVIKRDDGYIYISKANPLLIEHYQNREDLLKVLKYYAYSYISDEIIYNENLQYPNITDDNLKLNPSHLTNMNIHNANLPSDKIYRIKKDFKFKENSNILGIKTKTYLKYVNHEGNLIGSYPIDFKKKISDIIKDHNLFGGYYAVFELDETDEEIPNYYIYYDVGAPILKAKVLDKDGERDITFNPEYIKDNSNLNGANLFRYIRYKIDDVLDLEDPNMYILKLSGGGFNNTYTKDEIKNIPEFSFESGHYGTINIYIYDRNYNEIKFSVQIAGDSPKVRYINLDEDNEDLIIRFSLYDDKSTFSKIKIYKYEIDKDNILNQNKVLLIKDSKSNLIDETKLYYEFNTGGKYQVEYEDSYGRVYIDEAIFYDKNLPNIKLKGVLNKGITNKDVEIISSLNNEIYVYKILDNNKKQILSNDEISIENSITQNMSLIKVIAEENITENKYYVLVINKDDKGSYREYSFEIDSVICNIFINDINGGSVLKDSAINKAFKISTDEINSKIYISKRGSYESIYKNGEYIKEDGEYQIRVKDRANNESIFKIILDTKVQYRLKGEYIQINDRILSKNAVAIELLENISNIENAVLKSPGIYVVTNEGLSEVIIEDRVGNKDTILIEIDLSAPAYKILGLKDNNVSNSKVSIEIEDNSILEVRHNNKSYEYTDKVVSFLDEGEYIFSISDVIGNKSQGRFKIDRTVSYTSNLKLKNMYGTSNISIRLKEDGDIKVYLDKKEIPLKDEFTTNGSYEIHISDIYGNTEVLNYVKLDSLSKGYTLAMFKNQKIISSFKDNEVINKNDLNLNESGTYVFKIQSDDGIYDLKLSVDNIKPAANIKLNKNNTYSISKFNKPNLKYALYQNGKEIKFTNTIKKPGKYTLYLEDNLGNKNTYEFNLKRKLKPVEILFLSIFLISMLSISIYILYRRKRLKVS